MYRIILLICVGFVPIAVMSQGTIEGTVMDTSTGEPLVGANVVVMGTDLGAATDENGTFVVNRVPRGEQTVEISHIGFRPVRRTIMVTSNTRQIRITMEPVRIYGKQVIIEPTRAVERQTPVTFSSLDEEELRLLDPIQDIPLMLADLPSTKTYSETGTGLGYSYLNIRGFDQRRISVLINGIPQNDPEDHNVYWIDFFDLIGSLKDIQVQRGAGTAFYGPAAIGGSVNLVTQNYSIDPGFGIETQFGSYDTRKLSIEGVTGLLGDHWIGYGRLTRVTTENYRDWNWMEFWRYFAGIGYFTESHILKIQTYAGPQEDGLAYYGIPKEYIDDPDKRTINYSSATKDVEWFNQPHYELLHQWQLSEDITMNNTLYLIRGYGYFDYDGSWAPPSYYRLPAEEFTPESWTDTSGTVRMASNTMIRAYVDNRQGGFLHRYNWNHPGGTLTAGISVRGHQSLHWGRIQETDGLIFSDTLQADTSTVSVTPEYAGSSGNKYYRYNGGKNIYSIFAHEVLSLSETVTLLTDVQVTSKKYRFWNEKYLGHTFTVPYFFFNPSIGLNINLTSKVNSYLHLARTTREPRLKNYYDAAEASQPASWGPITPQFVTDTTGAYDYTEPLVRPETLYDVEFGFGYRDRSSSFNLNLYLMNFRDEIVKNGQLDRFGQPVTGNASRTRHYGVEIAGARQLSRGLRLSGNFTTSKNEFVDYMSYDKGDTLDLSGNTIAGFPAVMANLQLRYTSGQYFTTLSGKFIGKQYTTNLEDNGPEVDPYTVYNLRMGYTLNLGNSRLETALSVMNIFDWLYATHGEDTDFFPAAPRRYFISLNYEL